MANSMAILTDAFPVGQRGMALGINQVAALAGSFMGLLIGGLLADTNWRAVFLVSVPFGIFGTVWGYLKLREVGQRGARGRIDWAGNFTFGIGLIAVLVGITYGIQPYGGHTMGWSSPLVLSLLLGGAALLGVFLVVERRSADPLFHLDLFRIRAFSAGNLAGLLASVSRGGLQFMLIIWLQGIWLPLHGYSFASTPLWAGIYMIPLTLGFLVAGPVSGWLSDHHGARPFATGGMLLTAASFGALMVLPIDFPYLVFAALLLANGIGSGLFAAPNTAGIMNSVPARQRGAASGMRATFQNAGFVLSIGLFFSLMIAGLAARLPTTLYSGLTANGVPPATAERIANLPPVGSLFAAFLGYNPIRTLLGPAALARLSPAQAANLTGTSFFPRLIAEPFRHGLAIVFLAALVMSVVAAGASWMRGGRYVHEEPDGSGSGATREQQAA
jgi:MFS family permease